MRPFKNVITAHPSRSVFDLSYTKLLTMDMGQLIPVVCDEMVPGDKFSFGNHMVIRMMPLVAPVLHEIKAYIHYFFVPYRLLWSGWETFISGGVNGTDASTLPRWDMVGSAGPNSALWDYLGFPPGLTPFGAYPLDFPRRAYNFIWNEFYRDETLQTAIAVETDPDDAILYRNWSKDYFTSALPWQQRGTAPALPISGIVHAVFDEDVHVLFGTSPNTVTGTRVNPSPNVQMGTVGVTADATNEPVFISHEDLTDHNDVDLSGATTFDVSDLRLAFQIQKWMERNARAGVRYTEFLHAHFGVSPRDERLQRPEYLGGSVSPVVVSEVLQTSETTENHPQGNMSGHGISINTEFAGKYFATEFGLVMGLLSIMPVPMYTQGINRQWLRRSRYDFYFPEFANLSEQAIEQAELYVTEVELENTAIFGYQGRYDEMRYKPNLAVAKMRDDFAHWHLARVFGASPDLNEDFIKCVPDKRIFAVESEPGFLVSCGNIIKAVRPIPIMSEPGLIDHN